MRNALQYLGRDWQSMQKRMSWQKKTGYLHVCCVRQVALVAPHSLRPYGPWPTRLLCPQARTQQWVAMPSQASCLTQGSNCISYVPWTGRGFFTTSATWEAYSLHLTLAGWTKDTQTTNDCDDLWRGKRRKGGQNWEQDFLMNNFNIFYIVNYMYIIATQENKI